jgi:hypothetical protein
MVFVFLIFSFITTEAYLDRGGHILLLTYDIQGLSRFEAINRVDIWFHYKGEPYLVATHSYPSPVTSISDTFPWFSKDRWEGGDLEVVFYRVNGSRVSKYIPESSIQERDLTGLFPFPTPDEKDGISTGQR